GCGNQVFSAGCQRRGGSRGTKPGSTRWDHAPEFKARSSRRSIKKAASPGPPQSFVDGSVPEREISLSGSLVWNKLQAVAGTNLVSPTIASWNQLEAWLRSLQVLRNSLRVA